MTKYNAELKQILGNYAQMIGEREKACEIALNVLHAYAEPPRSDSEAPASVPREPDPK